MANFHSRSNSLPSKSHPVMDDIEDHLCRLKGSEATSTSATSLCSNLASLVNLHEGINNLIKMPSNQQALLHNQCGTWINEMLDGSLRLVDLCGFSREIVCLTKESVQELESSIRRNRGDTATADDINSYMVSRKKINKMVNKCIKNLKSFNQNSIPLLENDDNCKAIATMMKEMEGLTFSVLKSILILVSGAKGSSKSKSWSLLSKFTQTSRVHSETDKEDATEELCPLDIHKSLKSIDSISVQNILKKLKASEMTIHELEDGLEAFFRSLVKTRVSLLNLLSH